MRTCARAAVAVVVLSVAPALAAPQSLGDAARKQARERSRQAPPARVYTDADLHEDEDAPAGAAADVPAPSLRDDASVEPPGAKDTAEDAVRAQLDREAEARRRRERSWRGLARAAAARLAQAQRTYDDSCGSNALVFAGG